MLHSAIAADCDIHCSRYLSQPFYAMGFLDNFMRQGLHRLRGIFMPRLMVRIVKIGQASRQAEVSRLQEEMR